jgi:hypothetical protein
MRRRSSTRRSNEVIALLIPVASMARQRGNSKEQEPIDLAAHDDLRWAGFPLHFRRSRRHRGENM